MEIIIIYGAPAVGKLTVAQALAKKTNYLIIHNHMTIDLAVQFFPFGSKSFYRLIHKLRFSILEELSEANTPGVVWTTGLPNIPEVNQFYKKLSKFAKRQGIGIHYTHLFCDVEEQKKRIRGASRKKFQKLHNITQLENIMRKTEFSLAHHDKKTLHIDNTNLKPEVVAEQIISHLKLIRSNKK